MQLLSHLSEEDRERITKDLDALYLYLDVYLDTMTSDEVLVWMKVLEELDPNYKKQNENV